MTAVSAASAGGRPRGRPMSELLKCTPRFVYIRSGDFGGVGLLTEGIYKGYYGIYINELKNGKKLI